jgi:BCD family chlorophyll transporter-like MFS transporter
MKDGFLGWMGIVRLGLVQTALGAIVVLTTSTINRIMVVELALPAMLPGALVALHYAMQALRPRLGYGSDVGGRRTPWILGGMAVLAAGGVLAAVATAWMDTALVAGILLAIVAFALVGAGVGAAGTTLLVLLAKRVAPGRRAVAATTVWVMMIAGFILTTAIAGQLLDPYTPARLVEVSCGVALVSLLVAAGALWGVESRAETPAWEASVETQTRDGGTFREALAQVWSEPGSRHFTIFVFVSMLAYSAQDLILEPFAGTVFGFTPGESTKLSGIQHAGVLAGMIFVPCAVRLVGGRVFSSLLNWTVIGCVLSAIALSCLAASAFAPESWPLRATVFALGVANGMFAVSAIGSMMDRVASGRRSREGVRMGLWGAAQAFAFGLGGFIGTAAFDLARWVFGSAAVAYSTVFAAEAGLFLLSTLLAARMAGVARPEARSEGVSPARPTASPALARGTQ